MSVTLNARGESPSRGGEAEAVSAVPEVSIDQLDGEICRLAGQLAAATCHWLELIAEFDQRDGAAKWGMASTAHWLSFRCALSPGTAREHVRVARALCKLPILRAHFAAGTLSYSQARAITRVAFRLPEVEAELVEHARHMSAAQLEDLCQGIRAGDEGDHPPRRRRYLRRYYDDDGWLVIHGRIPPEEGALIDAALSAWDRNDEQPDADASAGTSQPSEDVETAQVPAADEIAEAVSEDEDSDERPRPERDAADALVAMAEALLAHGVPSSRADRYQVIIQVDMHTLQEDAPGTCRIAGGPALHPETVLRLCCESATATMQVNGPFEVLNLGRASRSPNTAQRRALLRRDQGRCRFPGCRAQRYVEAHHIVWWSLGGRTDLNNLLLLCRRHHMLVHEGGYRIGVDGPASFTFYRPDGVAIRLRPTDQPSEDGATPPPQPALTDQAITAETLPPKWGADRGQIDYPYAIACFLEAAHHRRRAATAGEAA